MLGGINQAEAFVSRDECETDAKQQGYPVTGLRRTRREGLRAV